MKKLFTIIGMLILSESHAAKMCVNCGKAFEQAKTKDAYSIHNFCSDQSGTVGQKDGYSGQYPCPKNNCGNGQFCWCRASIGSACAGSWVLMGNLSSGNSYDDCSDNCNFQCQTSARGNSAFRTALLSPGS
ncbi:MAG: hypothetical protein LBL21_00495 [Rickettsiales bacterium]|nr:hypothetical protein [Rickettsiales bacterium]